MSAAPPSRREPTAKPLSRERIIAAALRIIDADGADALSMRRLAATLGVQAMSLYNHVGGKADLIDGVAEFVTREMRLPKPMEGSWEDRIRTIAHAFRRTSLRHPRACQLVLTRQLSSPTALAPIDCSLTVLLDHGFDEETAVRALRLFTAYQVGCLLREFYASSENRGEDDAAVRERTGRLAGSDFPAVARVAPMLAVIDHEAEFAFGVETLIEGLRKHAPPPAAAGREGR
ncbi:TetR/AcrR family transcriptional regulator C-terminal domain-containing protein [Streptomyces sp. MUM 178J]|uniref:TetR/AcrR family transcriptional regulator C-terminal domain-containing protein n=1 Tax=Streptomyces sp. MUM 178J TaxID=2791991 RepID=UPI001F039B09|nr:TetR/AcrR family transcriptional regulator C-terminal domain-containing protein [Streptomyces sp. MUM 178J]WRQ82379.1 TetR/AcrR family transcriptional regulator C-terminal domain-containing protein [Streptomyces sp. MUM 178J]